MRGDLEFRWGPMTVAGAIAGLSSHSGGPRFSGCVGLGEPWARGRTRSAGLLQANRLRACTLWECGGVRGRSGGGVLRVASCGWRSGVASRAGGVLGRRSAPRTRSMAPGPNAVTRAQPAASPTSAAKRPRAALQPARTPGGDCSQTPAGSALQPARTPRRLQPKRHIYMRKKSRRKVEPPAPGPIIPGTRQRSLF